MNATKYPKTRRYDGKTFHLETVESTLESARAYALAIKRGRKKRDTESWTEYQTNTKPTGILVRIHRAYDGFWIYTRKKKTK